jgi:hypothetical protein
MRAAHQSDAAYRELQRARTAKTSSPTRESGRSRVAASPQFLRSASGHGGVVYRQCIPISMAPLEESDRAALILLNTVRCFSSPPPFAWIPARLSVSEAIRVDGHVFGRGDNTIGGLGPFSSGHFLKNIWHFK